MQINSKISVQMLPLLKNRFRKVTRKLSNRKADRAITLYMGALKIFGCP